MADPVDWSDPCARSAALRAAYNRLLSGEFEVEIRTRTLDAEEMVKFATPDLATLRVEMEAANAECEALNGGGTAAPRRRAIAGTYRMGW